MSAAPSVGQILGHYRILEQIGAGGMGIVYRAHDEQLERDVALKVLPTGMLIDEIARKRFRKEALLDSPLVHIHLYVVDFLQHDSIGMEREVAAVMGKPGYEDLMLY